MQRGLSEINAVIDRRIDEARREFIRRGGAADPEPEIIILGGERRARAETAPSLTPQQRADLSADIAATIRAELQRSPRDIVRERQQAEAQQAGAEAQQTGAEETQAQVQVQSPRLSPVAGGDEPVLTEDQQRRVDATRRAVARRKSPSPQRRRSPSPNPQEDPLTDEGSLDPFGSGRERELRRAFRSPSPRQTDRERRAEQEFYERQPSPGVDVGGLSPASALDIPEERLQRGGGRGAYQYSGSDDTSGSGELIFNIDDDEVDQDQREGLLAGGARLLQQAGGAVIQGASHAIARGAELVDELQRPAPGEQTGGRLDPEGQIVGLGQEIEVQAEPEPPPSPRAEAVEGRGQIEEVEEVEQPALAGGGTPGSLEEGEIFEVVEREGAGVTGAEQRSNYSEYQALRGDLEALAGRRGGKRAKDVEEFIPFAITNVSDEILKKINPGETIQLKGVLRGGEVRYVVPGTLKSTKIQKQVLERLIREGKLKVSRRALIR